MIYRFVYRRRLRDESLHRYLPRAKATRDRHYYKRCGALIQNRVSIHERPEAIKNRKQFTIALVDKFLASIRK